MSCDGVAPTARTRTGPDPPRSASVESSESQFEEAKKSADRWLKVGPGLNRMIASPSLQVEAPKVLHQVLWLG